VAERGGSECNERVGVEVGANGERALIKRLSPFLRILQKVYLWFFARARGLLNGISFFIINRVIGLLVITLGYRTHMTISFEHLREF
jgi:hypothetical protein